MAAEGQEDMLDFNAQKMDDQMGELLEYAPFFPPTDPYTNYRKAPSKTTP
jgi:hypothetical protein